MGQGMSGGGGGIGVYGGTGPGLSGGGGGYGVTSAGSLGMNNAAAAPYAGATERGLGVPVLGPGGQSLGGGFNVSHFHQLVLRTGCYDLKQIGR